MLNVTCVSLKCIKSLGKSTDEYIFQLWSNEYSALMFRRWKNEWMTRHVAHYFSTTIIQREMIPTRNNRKTLSLPLKLFAALNSRREMDKLSQIRFMRRKRIALLADKRNAHVRAKATVSLDEVLAWFRRFHSSFEVTTRDNYVRRHCFSTKY